MTNKEIYKKTLGFSLRRVLWDFIALVLLAGLAAAGYMIGDKAAGSGIIGLLIGAVIGLIVLIIIVRFVSFMLKAGQIAMMTRGVAEGALPDDVIAEGKKTVKERFTTLAVYFAVTGAIKGIFRQLGRLITKVGESIGGDAGGAVGSTVSSVMQTIVNYLCDCCLGWIFFRKDEKPAKAACEGAVLFFRHGKTFIKNMGRVFGIGLASFVIIAGPFFGLLYLILSKFPEAYEKLAAELSVKLADSTSALATWLKDPKAIPIVFAALGGIIIWSVIHSVFIRPYVLVGVLRNYIESGRNDIPSEASFAELDSKSAKFRKLHEQF
ncbi:MAG: hypothetical protein J6252_00200 [Clostridia bacterium]|nr:hypothetical protein [Clostridia bacterium]